MPAFHVNRLESIESNVIARLKAMVTARLKGESLSVDGIDSLNSIAEIETAIEKLEMTEDLRKTVNRDINAYSAVLGERDRRKNPLGSTIDRTGSRYNVAKASFTDDVEAQLLELEGEIKDAIRASGGTVVEGDPTNQLSRLGTRDRQKFASRYRKILGFDEMITEQGIGEWVVSPDDLGRVNTGSNVFSQFNFDPAQPTTAVESMLSNMYVNFRPSLSDISAPDSDSFFMSGNLLTVETAKRYAKQYGEGAQVPRGPMAVFDLETGGVSPGSGVFQMSVRYSDTGDIDTLFFRNPIMERGIISDGVGGTTTIAERMMGGASYSTLDDLKATLSRMVKTDMLAGHNIDKFDLPFLLGSFDQMAESVRGADDELLDLFERFRAKVARGETWDTLAMLRTNARHLEDIPIHPGLQDLARIGAIGPPNRFSLQNILMTTNLLEVTARHSLHSEREIIDMVVRQGTHDADIDTLFESILAEYSDEVRVREAGADLAFGSLTEDDVLDFMDRVAHSKAMTPHIPVEWDDVTPGVQRYIETSLGVTYDEAAQLGQLGKFQLTPIEIEAIEQRMAAMGMAKGTRFDPLMARTQAGLFEQFLAEHEIGSGKPIGSHIPGYEQVQERMARDAIPFYELSTEERRVNSVLAKMGLSITPVEDRLVGDLMSDLLPTTRFFSADKIGMAGNGSVVFMPIDVLAEAEAAHVFDVIGPDGQLRPRTGFATGEQMYDLSPFKYTAPGGRTAYNISEDFIFSEDPIQARKEIEQLSEFLLDTKRVGEKEVKEIREHLIRSLEGRGRPKIQVGLARPTNVSVGTDDPIGRAYETLVEAMGGDPNMGQGKIDDASAGVRYRVGHTGEVVTTSTGHTYHTAGPAVLESTTYGDGARAYRDQALDLQDAYDRVRDLGTDDSAFRAAQAKKAQRQTLDTMYGRVRDLISDMPTSRKRLLAGVGATTLGVAGYFAYDRKQDRDDWFNETRESMPAESGQWYEDYQREMSPQFMYSSIKESRARTLNSLSTSNIVSDLSYNRINHTKMGNNKYAHLYAA